MSEHEVRKGIANAEHDERNFKVMYVEILIISIFLGYITQSWWVFGGVLMGLLLSLKVTVLANIIVYALSFAWGFLGYVVGKYSFESIGASVVLAILGFLIGLGTHYSGLRRSKDISLENEIDNSPPPIKKDSI